MEYKRDFDGAGLGDHDDGHDPKRLCLPPPDDSGQYSSQYWDQVGDGQSTELAWMNDEFLPPNLDQLQEFDADSEQTFTPFIDSQQLMDWSVTIDSTRQSSLVVPSPTPATEETKACEEDQGSEAKEVDTCFGVVGFLQVADL